MQCEICGATIRGQPMRIVVEQAEMVVCDSCARHGRSYVAWSRGAKPGVAVGGRRFQTSRRVAKPRRAAWRGEELDEEFDLVPDYPLVIRRARERKGWTHEDLAKRINEKVSVIHRLESRRMRPSIGLARKLERELGVELLEEVADIPLDLAGGEEEESTIGDVVQIKKKND